jgi:membrane-bound serine protease (ClpP class)
MTHVATRRWVRRALAALSLFLGVVVLTAAPAAPAAPASPSPQTGTDCSPEESYVKALKVDGRLDSVMVDFVTSEVDGLADTCAQGLLLQLNSSGLSDDRDAFDDLLEAVSTADRPIEVWVGPSGSQATGDAAELLEVADRIGLAQPRARIEVTEELVAARGLEVGDLGTARVGDEVRAERALELGLVDSAAPTISEFAAEMDVVETELITEDGEELEVPVTPVISAELPLLGQLMHTVASAPVAYLLFVIGLALLLFELFSAGVGIAGAVGAGCLVLACYGLASLPTSPWGVALLLFAMFGYAVDVQTGVPRVWTGIATVAFILGSLTLYNGAALSWITLLVTFIGMTIFMLRGMPVMVRSRFSTSSIDRGWLTGEAGMASTELQPEGQGVILVQDAPWPARSHGEALIEAGAAISVVGPDGYLLEVEASTGTSTTTEDAD